MQEETKLFAELFAWIGAASGIIGLAHWIKGVNRAQIEHEIEMKTIMAKLDRIVEIDEHLEDVLNHPTDTVFSNKDVGVRQLEIISRLDKIEQYVRQRRDQFSAD